MDIRPGWFTESWDEIAISIEVEEVLYSEKSNYQDILVFKRLVWYIYLSLAALLLLKRMQISSLLLIEGCVFSVLTGVVDFFVALQ